MIEDRQELQANLDSIWDESSKLMGIAPSARVAHIAAQMVQNVRRSVATFLLTVLTIAMAVSLVGFFLLSLHNASSRVTDSVSDLSVVVFFKDSATPKNISDVQLMVKESGVPVSTLVVDKVMALERFRRSLGSDAGLLDGLEDDNPLPVSLHVTLQSLSDVENLYASLVSSLSDRSFVDTVRYSEGDVDVLKKVMRGVEVVGFVVVLLLGVLASFVIANTIRLALVSHRIEIDIMRLIGAKRREIFAPFLLEGFLQGLCGAGLAIGFLYFGVIAGRSVIPQIEVLQFVVPNLLFVPGDTIVGLIAMGAGVGLSGSFIAVRRFLTEVRFRG